MMDLQVERKQIFETKRNKVLRRTLISFSASGRSDVGNCENGYLSERKNLQLPEHFRLAQPGHRF
jgi:hypothetical protein